MDVREFEEFVPGVLERMEADGYCDLVVKRAALVFRRFVEYCREEGVGDVGDAAVADFCKSRYGFDIDEATKAQKAVRKPLLTALELYRTGTYLTRHQKARQRPLPKCMEGAYALLVDECIGRRTDLAPSTKQLKAWSAYLFISFLGEQGVRDMGDVELEDLDRFAASLSRYAPETARRVKGDVRGMLSWLAQQGVVSFDGRAAFPQIGGAASRSSVPSCFSRDEVDRIISCIDPSTARGKTHLAIVSLLAFTGMRSGDVIWIDLPDIDWEAGVIHIVQRKTGSPLDVPMTDEVRFPLIDYIRDARPSSSADPDALFITPHAPRTRIRTQTTIYNIVEHCVREAGIDVAGRRHGPHALRHSLATNMLGDDAPLHVISKALGHSGVKVTERYLSVDYAHARELALEVPL